MVTVDLQRGESRCPHAAVNYALEAPSHQQKCQRSEHNEGGPLDWGVRTDASVQRQQSQTCSPGCSPRTRSPRSARSSPTGSGVIYYIGDDRIRDGGSDWPPGKLAREKSR